MPKGSDAIRRSIEEGEKKRILLHTHANTFCNSIALHDSVIFLLTIDGFFFFHVFDLGTQCVGSMMIVPAALL